MSKTKKEKKVKVVPIGIGILVFVLAFVGGMVSKVAIKPSWAKNYSVQWSDELGTLKTDLSYGDGEANKFDLYLPKDNTKESYGLVVYLHAGGFTSGDKTDDKEMLAWLCSKGYVACGMLYCADGYVTAWFMWQLQGDEYAAGAFTGDEPEIMKNRLYQDQKAIERE